MNAQTVARRIAQAGATSGSYNSPESLKASSGVRNLLKAAFPDGKVYHSTGYFYCSGFVELRGKYVYYNSGDYRSGFGFYARTAEHLKDYTGGPNNGCTVEKLVWVIGELLQRQLNVVA